MSNKEHATTEYTEGQIEGSARHRTTGHINTLENRPKDIGVIKYALLTPQHQSFLHSMSPLHFKASFSPVGWVFAGLRGSFKEAKGRYSVIACSLLDILKSLRYTIKVVQIFHIAERSHICLFPISQSNCDNIEMHRHLLMAT